MPLRCRQSRVTDSSIVGRAPGPTFEVQRGREAVVRFINHSDRETSVHLHGSYSRAPFDGWAEDTALVGQYKDYCKCKKPSIHFTRPILAATDIQSFSRRLPQFSER